MEAGIVVIDAEIMPEQEQVEQEFDFARLDALGQALAQKRKDDIEWREQSGVEDRWSEDQEAYDGIDDANRGEQRYTKPASSAGRLTQQTTRKTPGSTVFVNISAPYVDMAAARVADMLLPTDDMPFGIQPTPIPDLEEYEKSADLEQLPDGSVVPVQELAKQMKDKAAEIADKAETRIWDWLVESQWHSEVRKVIEDAARIGVGVLKGPFPAKRKIQKLARDEYGALVPAFEHETRPQSKRIDVRNLYPAKGCGESIHNGPHIWERDYLTKKQLSDLRGGDYIDEQIAKCLKEGPGGSTDPDDSNNDEKQSLYEIWYYNGQVEADDMAAAGCECGEDEEYDPVNAILTIVNDRVIKAAMAPLDSGKFPYDVFPWQRVGGSWAGSGVARQVSVPQRMINSTTRALMDNGGLSAKPMIFMRRNGITPADGGPMGIAPGRIFWVEDGDLRRVEDSIKALEIPTMQGELSAIINYALDLAERLTSMPLMMQGQQGSATETVGGMKLLQNNAGAVLRRIAKGFDDNITEPHIQRYYEWLLLYGDETEKGDLQIDARGSSALFERDAQNQSILEMAAIVKDPAFGINPEKWIIEAFKAQKLDPARFQFTDEEKEQRKQQPPPADPALQIAEMRAKTEVEKERMRQESDAARLQIDREEAEMKRQHDKEMAMLNRDIKMMELSAKTNMSIEQIKASLAKETMKLTTQRELSDKALRASKEASTPLVEPAGKAPKGQAYAL